jgi:hypothetical protein
MFLTPAPQQTGMVADCKHLADPEKRGFEAEPEIKMLIKIKSIFHGGCLFSN